MYKVCVYMKVDEYNLDDLSDLVDFFAVNHPLDLQYKLTVDFVDDGNFTFDFVEEGM